MKQKVIEPSEILVGPDGTVYEKRREANPWIRFLARMFDYSLFFALLWTLSWKRTDESIVPFEYFLWIPLEAACLWAFGTTPGKWVLGIQIRQGKRDRFDYITAFRRSFHVWFRGLGMGIPIINLLCMYFAFQRLKVFRITSWDRDDHVLVVERTIGRWRVILAAVVATVGLLFYFTNKYS